jgi:hypothetical protein
MLFHQQSQEGEFATRQVQIAAAPRGLERCRIQAQCAVFYHRIGSTAGAAYQRAYPSQ